MMNNSVCRVCLGGGVRMRRIEDTELLELYEKLTNAMLHTDLGHPSTLCYICTAQLLGCRRFSEQAQRSNKFLSDLLLNYIEVTHETVSSLKLGCTQNLTISILNSTSYYGHITDSKNETSNAIKIERTISTDDIKSEEDVECYYYCSICEQTSLTKNELEVHLNTHTELQSDEETKVTKIYEEETTTKKKNEDRNLRKTIGAKRIQVETINGGNDTSIIKVSKINADSKKKWKVSINEVETNESKINEVKASIKKEQTSAKCQVCDKVFSNAKALKFHASVHTGAKPYICSDCGLSFRIRVSLRNHITVHHTKEKKFKCETCNKAFFLKKGLIYHKESLKCSVQYKCEDCDLKFSCNKDLKEHKVSHIGERKYGCDRCDKAFIKKAYLKRHLSKVHLNCYDCTCNECGKNFKHLSTLRTHMQVHSKQKLFTCDTCNKTFAYSSSYKEHMLLHAGVKRDLKFCCDRCSKKFRSKADLKAHMRMHTGEKPFKCETCGKAFSQRGNLWLHLKIHSGQKCFACEKCGKTFRLNYQLQVHMSTHALACHSHSCHRCLRTFRFPSALKEHLKRMHTEVKPYPCNLCGRSFDHPASLAAHTRRHSSPRSHSCPTCHKSYGSRDNLKKHVAVHSSDKPYACRVCNKTFKILRYLQQHKLSASCRRKTAAKNNANENES